MIDTQQIELALNKLEQYDKEQAEQARAVLHKLIDNQLKGRCKDCKFYKLEEFDDKSAEWYECKKWDVGFGGDDGININDNFYCGFFKEK